MLLKVLFVRWQTFSVERVVIAECISFRCKTEEDRHTKHYAFLLTTCYSHVDLFFFVRREWGGGEEGCWMWHGRAVARGRVASGPTATTVVHMLTLFIWLCTVKATVRRYLFGLKLGHLPLVNVFVFRLTAAVCCLARQGCVTGREGDGGGGDGGGEKGDGRW